MFVAPEKRFVESFEVWSRIEVDILLAENLPHAFEIIDNQAATGAESDWEHLAVDLGEDGESLVRHLESVHQMEGADNGPGEGAGSPAANIGLSPTRQVDGDQAQSQREASLGESW